MEKEKIDILALPLEALHQILKEKFSKGIFHAEAVYKNIFKLGSPALLSAPEFENSPKLAEMLEKKIILEPGDVVDTFTEEKLTKFITRLADGLKIESVIIPMTRHSTLCVSSQAGCRMG